MHDRTSNPPVPDACRTGHIDDDSTIVGADKTERHVRWQGDREGCQASVHDPSHRSKAMRCDGCKHWKRDDDDMKEVKGLGKCHKAIQLWDATEWTKNADGEDDCCGRTVKAGLAGQMSFVVDASQYHAALWTKPEFFCAHHEAAH